MMIRKILRTTMTALLAVCFIGGTTAWAQTPEEKLLDNVLEYSEARDLVHNYNPALSAGWQVYTDNVQDLGDTINNIRMDVKEIKEMRDEAKKAAEADPTDPAAGQAYMAYEAGIQALSKVRSSLNSSYKNLEKEKNAQNYTLRIMEDQLTSAVESLIIAYQTIAAQEEMLTQMVTFYEGTLEAKRVMTGQGTATAADLLSAQTDLLSAQKSLSALTAAKQQIYRQLITLCGWQNDAAVTIGPVPDPDPAVIAAMNPATDLSTAMTYNTSLATLHKSKKDKSVNGKKKYQLTESEMQNKLKIRLQELYGDVLSAQESWRAAQAGYQSALASKDAADRQFALGLISELQYQGLRMAFLQKKAALESARCDLVQAVNSYQAALAGNCDLS